MMGVEGVYTLPKLMDLVERPAIAAETHEPLAEAAKLMLDNRIGSLVVMDDTGELAGIFTERDLLRACAAGIDTHASTIGKWMTEDPVTAPADAEAAAALQTMIDRDFRHLPVLGEGGVVGVVSMRKLSRALQRQRMG